MQDLLANPAIQGGVAPFVLGLLVSLVFIKLKIGQGLAILSGLLVTTALTTGISFTPLNSTRKLVLISIIVAVVALLYALDHKGRARATLMVPIGMVVAIGWILWPFISRQPLVDVWFPIVASAGFVAWVSAFFLSLRYYSINQVGLATAALGFGLGGTALLGASALLGQMAMSLGAAALAMAFIQIVFAKDNSAGLTLCIIAGSSLALIAPTAVIFAKVPWLSLLFLSFIPILAHLPIAESMGKWAKAFTRFLLYMTPSIAAIYLAWKSAGDLPF
jgi:hypothetical protein